MSEASGEAGGIPIGTAGNSSSMAEPPGSVPAKNPVNMAASSGTSSTYLRGMRRSASEPFIDEAAGGQAKPIVVGVCAMDKKARSKPMAAILDRLCKYNEIEAIIFGDAMMLHEPIERWPLCDCLISFSSDGFPLDKAQAYVDLRRPYLINDVAAQNVLLDRRRVYSMLHEAGIRVPSHIVVSRDGYGGRSKEAVEAAFIESDEYVELDGTRIYKPFVEKPISGDDHNIRIYYPGSAGGGMKSLFRKIADRAAAFTPGVFAVRRDGSYIYENFLLTGGTDVKVYTVGPGYAHAEARKSPAVDGKVQRNAEGKEVRYPILLTPAEKQIARQVCLASRQAVCGFDLLRSNGKSFVCDVNGWSFVKNSVKYYDDAAALLRTAILAALAPHVLMRGLPLRPAASFRKRQQQEAESDAADAAMGGGGGDDDDDDDNDDAAAVAGKPKEELRCVLAVVRHGDRTPKQKMKMVVHQPKLIDLHLKWAGGPRKQAKLKTAHQLQDLLDVVRSLLAARAAPSEENSSSADEERAEDLEKLRHVKAVLEEGGHFSGINRKVQLKPLKWAPVHKTDSLAEGSTRSGVCSVPPISIAPGGSVAADGDVGSEGGGGAGSDGEGERAHERCTEVLLILKYGGVLTLMGAKQAECLGLEFRTRMYPGEATGFLRLHSTYRHDLKIYSSDEGRVQMSAAAFTKAFLDLEGQLTPILVSLVSKDASMLDDSHEADDAIRVSKARLYTLMTAASASRPRPSSASAFAAAAAAAATVAAAAAGAREEPLPEHVPPEPRRLLYRMYRLIQGLVRQLRGMCITAGVISPRALPDDATESESDADCRRSDADAEPDEDLARRRMVAAASAAAATSALPGSLPKSTGGGSTGGGGGGSSSGRLVIRAPTIPLVSGAGVGQEPGGGEGLLLMYARWSKLEKDLLHKRKHLFDISKVPDCYDNAKYDMLHNAHLRLVGLEELYAVAKLLADGVIANEYGVDPRAKLVIGSSICRKLLAKLLGDLVNASRDDIQVPHMEAPRPGMTAWDGISAWNWGHQPTPATAPWAPHSGHAPLSAAGGSGITLPSLVAAPGVVDSGPGVTPGTPLRRVSVHNVTGSGAVPMDAEDLHERKEALAAVPGESPGRGAQETSAAEADGAGTLFTRLDWQRAVDIKSPQRHVRTRIYFTSESHVHSLLNVLRFAQAPGAAAAGGGDVGEGVVAPDAHARRIMGAVTELDYLTQIVFRMYENTDPALLDTDPKRFRVEISFSPGANHNLLEGRPPGAPDAPLPHLPRQMVNANISLLELQAIIDPYTTPASLRTGSDDSFVGASKPATPSREKPKLSEAGDNSL